MSVFNAALHRIGRTDSWETPEARTDWRRAARVGVRRRKRPRGLLAAVRSGRRFDLLGTLHAARPYALGAWGEQVHVAPTWDRGEPWLSTLRHIAKEGRVVVVGCCQAVRKDDIPDSLAFKAKYLGDLDGWINPGGSVIIDPDGKTVAGPAMETEAVLYADIRHEQLVGPRWQLDIGGHYARPDVFELVVHKKPKPLIRTEAAVRRRKRARR